MPFKVIPRFKLAHPADPTMPYINTDGKPDECVIVSNAEALILQQKYHIMSCQIAREEDYGLSGHIFRNTVVAIRGEVVNGRVNTTKEIFHVSKILKKLGCEELNSHEESSKEEPTQEAIKVEQKPKPVAVKKEIKQVATVTKEEVPVEQKVQHSTNTPVKPVAVKKVILKQLSPIKK